MMLLFYPVFILLWGAAASRISISGSTSVDYGSNAVYTCMLDNPTGVHQVTWQRLGEDESLQNVASYSERFGQQVNELYVNKVVFTNASLSSASIMLRNITWQDESCYVCSFDVFPLGSTRNRTCFTVRGISEVRSSHQVITAPQTEDRDLILSCSATGKPSPTIHWNYTSSAGLLDPPLVTTVTNADLTFTSSSNITLRIGPRWQGHVDCLVNAGMKNQRRERTSFSFRDETKHEGRTYFHLVYIIILVIFIIISTLMVITLKMKRVKHERVMTTELHLQSTTRKI